MWWYRIIFFALARKISSRIAFPWKVEIIKEYVYLTMIFINLIFIHVQRSIILVAHQTEKSVDKLYFYSLFGIILILIPYFRMRERLALGRHSGEWSPPIHEVYTHEDGLYQYTLKRFFKCLSVEGFLGLTREGMLLNSFIEFTIINLQWLEFQRTFQIDTSRFSLC